MYIDAKESKHFNLSPRPQETFYFAVKVSVSFLPQTSKIPGRETLKNGRNISGADFSNHYIF